MHWITPSVFIMHCNQTRTACSSLFGVQIALSFTVICTKLYTEIKLSTKIPLCLLLPWSLQFLSASRVWNSDRKVLEYATAAMSHQNFVLYPCQCNKLIHFICDYLMSLMLITGRNGLNFLFLSLCFAPALYQQHLRFNSLGIWGLNVPIYWAFESLMSYFNS